MIEQEKLSGYDAPSRPSLKLGLFESRQGQTQDHDIEPPGRVQVTAAWPHAVVLVLIEFMHTVRQTFYGSVAAFCFRCLTLFEDTSVDDAKKRMQNGHALMLICDRGLFIPMLQYVVVSTSKSHPYLSFVNASTQLEIPAEHAHTAGSEEEEELETTTMCTFNAPCPAIVLGLRHRFDTSCRGRVFSPTQSTPGRPYWQEGNARGTITWTLVRLDKRRTGQGRTSWGRARLRLNVCTQRDAADRDALSSLDVADRGNDKEKEPYWPQLLRVLRFSGSRHRHLSWTVVYKVYEDECGHALAHELYS
ncbi:hypothetical protein C8Q76DRAFT_698123 [Earliella scabrosa]|nr:hypothetical protein C8Q76DRAFT_698123 [Earliella scabrosa]